MVQPLRHDVTVSAERGMVLVDGPGSVAMTITPDVALVLSTALREAALLALRQAAPSQPPACDDTVLEQP